MTLQKDQLFKQDSYNLNKSKQDRFSLDSIKRASLLGLGIVLICAAEEAYISASWSRAIMSPIVRQVKSKPVLPQKPAQKPTQKRPFQKVQTTQTGRVFPPARSHKSNIQAPTEKTKKPHKVIPLRTDHSNQTIRLHRHVSAEKVPSSLSKVTPYTEPLSEGELNVIVDQIQTIQRQKKLLEEKQKALFNIFLNTQLFFANKTAVATEHLALTTLGLSSHESEDFVHRSILAKLCLSAPSKRLFWFARQFQSIHAMMSQYSQQEQKLTALYQEKKNGQTHLVHSVGTKGTNDANSTNSANDK